MSITETIGFKILEEGKPWAFSWFKNKKFFNFMGHYNGIETSYEKFCVKEKYQIKKKFRKNINSFSDKAKVALEVQKETEKAMIHLTRYAKTKINVDNLCISGGVALNCVANNIIKDAKIFKNVFINPGASDTGIPLGAVYHGFFHEFKNKKIAPITTPYLGIEYKMRDIKKSLNLIKGVKSLEIIEDPYLKNTLNALINNKAVGFFQGRSETGPRALGNRSIIMSPLREKNRYIFNKKIKLREEFRTFAPIIIEEEVSKYFEFDGSSPYMLFACKVKKKQEKKIPAAVHLDSTARIQTVNKKTNKRIYNLLKMFQKKTGVPVLINTSFNIKNEPIVETPDNAINCFLNTNIDALFIEGFFIKKK